MATPRGRRPAPQKDTTRINEDITAHEVRLIDHEGEQRGILNTKKALEIAEDAGLDLVEVSPNAEPPVCKIMDYGKFKYEQSKKQAAAKKNQHQVQVKELKFRPGTDIGDYNIKFKKLIDFIEKGNKVKCTVRFRGREMAHKDLGLEVLQRIEEDAKEIAQVEQRPSLEGRQMVMVISPLKKK